VEARKLTVKVIQWATGAKGSAMMRETIRNPALELVGAFVYSDDKHGVDCGVLAGLEPIGVHATNVREEIYALDADVVFHAPQLQPTMQEHDHDVANLLASGKNVISIVGYFNPEGLGPSYAGPLKQACLAGGSTLFGTGINPGFATERLAMTVSGLCTQINAIEVVEAYDVGCAPAFMLEVMGFGKPLAQYPVEANGEMWDRFYGNIPNEVAARWGQSIDRTERRHELVVADEDHVDGSLPIRLRAGAVAAQRWSWVGYVHGEPFFTFAAEWQLGKRQPGWAGRSAWIVTIDGDPCVRTTLEVHSSLDNFAAGVGEYNPAMMAAVVVNAIPEVLAAPPGFLQAPVFAPWRFPAS
jgi:hypothetical protein